MAEIEKLNKTFQREEVLTAENMNNITGKIDEVIKEVNNPTNTPKGGYNRTLYEATGAVYNEETGYYELNGLTDITEEQMDIIFSYGVNNSNDLTAAYVGFKGRTNLRNIIYPSIDMSRLNISTAFRENKNIEVACISNEFISNPKVNTITKSYTCFYNCIKLKKVQGILNLKNTTDSPSIIMNYCPNLEYILIYGLSKPIEFKQSSKLNKQCILYMIQNSAATSPITITLHADAYAMAMADEDIQAALAEKTNVSLATA